MKGDVSLFAAVDLGSNAFRMMIAQPVKHDRGLVIEEVKTLREPVRLAEGLNENALDQLALDRGWQALERFGKRLRGFPAGRVRAVATSAVRQANNAGLFLVGAEQRLGFPIEVITGHQEAHLVYTGIAHAMPSTQTKRLVVDIGGGSTEFIVGRGDQPVLTESLAIGSGTFGKRYFAGGRVCSLSLQEAERVACRHIEPISGRYRAQGWEQVLGSSGTARMLAKVLKCNGLNDPGHTGITYEGLLRLALRLLAAEHLSRLHLVGLQSQRLNLLPGGLAIMLAAFKTLGIESMTPSEPGLRLGLLHGLVHN
ncbi:Ppx/GppA family phosphatase [Pseudomonas sp. R5(2019)]|uniref:Ppx/GppA phosphatase family protein n=1 Tax=Pseudomonas sp. R5(2019) TaxID=2697566 RepID=UPI00141361B9|nr:Ppx/GppA family phosphatase [Pseudomonas sp. R5(2019)]NBA96705.1 Ppx/GppA family phosphatase [Pseudomonas sp. R5(2019)]